MVSTPQVIFAGRAELAEGPVWHAGALWWVDIIAGTLNRLDPETGINAARATGDFLGAAVPADDGRWVLARHNECSLFDWETGRLARLSAPEGVSSRHRFNDAKCSPSGRFWAGTMSLDRASGEAVLFAIGPDGQTQRVLSGISLSNGLAWSPAGDRFYHIDTPTRQLSYFDYDSGSETITGKKVLVQFGESDGFPDGMSIDAKGDLWVALWSGHSIAQVDGKTGTILKKHPMPIAQVSSCAFGGADLRTLYITSAWEGLSFDQRLAEPLAGSIFALRTDAPGLPVVPFRVQANPPVLSISNLL